jgi:hypothetical protein
MTNENKDFYLSAENFYIDDDSMYVSYAFDAKSKQKVFYDYSKIKMKLLLSASYYDSKTEWFEGKMIKTDNLEFLLFLSDDSLPS